MNKNNLNKSVQVMQDSSAIQTESKGDEKNQYPLQDTALKLRTFKQGNDLFFYQPVHKGHTPIIQGWLPFLAEEEHPLHC